MQICRSIAGIRAAVARFRAAGESVGLVTTMGALHAGHMSLVATAKVQDRVVATIFVNPSQFGDAADLAKYPRTEEADLAMLREAGVDAVFLPEASEIYPQGDETIVETVTLANMFHGKVRPGHFRGVATVVARFFNIVQADVAYFGEKDYQQLAVIRRMVRDLHFPIEIVGVPTLRETDGLAMSSRNVRLMPEDRNAAVVLSRALDAAEVQARNGATVEDLVRRITDTINSESRAQLLAVDIVDAASFTPVTGQPHATIGIMISASFGEVLLIDQREIVF